MTKLIKYIMAVGLMFSGSIVFAGPVVSPTSYPKNIQGATTVDTTNIEVTNVKAKDGTASATIADSTGIMTISSSVLTTADINGGTIDGAVIGDDTPLAGSFTSITGTGVMTVSPDGTNEVFQVNDGSLDFTDGNAGTTGTLTVDSSGNWSYNKALTAGAGSFATLTSSRTAVPAIALQSSSCTDSDDNAVIYANPTDTGSGTEDVDVYFQSQIAGTLTTFMNWDASEALLTVTGDASITGNVDIGGSIVFEGTTVNEHETTFAITDPTADRTITFPDASGTVALTDTAYGGMYMYESTDVVTIDAADEYHLVRFFSTEGTNGFTFNAGSTGAITAYADYSGTVAGTVSATSATHNLATGDDLSITGTTNYDGVYTVTVIDANTFYFTATWVADDATGTWSEGSYLEAGSTGVYLAIYSISADSVNNNKVFKFELFTNSSENDSTASQRNYAVGGDFGNCAGQGILSLTAGDRVYLGAMNTTDTDNLELEHANVTLHRL